MDKNNKEIKIEDGITLTEEQVSKVYDALEENNTSKEALDAAYDATETTEHNDIEELDEMPPLDEIPTVLPRDILKEAIKASDMGVTSDEEAESLIDLILEYRKDKSIKLYPRLPQGMQIAISKFKASLGIQTKRYNITNESLSRHFIDDIISSSSFDAALRQLDVEMFDAFNTMEKDMANIMDEAYNGIFDSIEQVRAEDPGKAEKIEKVKNAFEKAKNFDYQIEFLHTQKPRDVRKYHLRFNSICDTFNRIVNTNLVAIKIPNMEEIYEILKLWMPTVSKDQIKEFCALICKSVENMDFNDIGDTSYVHRLIDNIYVFKHRHTSTYSEYKDFFSEIMQVIFTIEEHKNSNKEVH